VSVVIKPYVKPPRLIKERGLVKNLRPGKGFSLCELSKAGLTPGDAKRLGIPVDPRRRSCHEWNVKLLESFLENLKRGQEAGESAAVPSPQS
jgi:large subunit ribosomal protein L13e